MLFLPQLEKFEKFHGFLIFILTSLIAYSLTKILNLDSLEDVLVSHWQILDIPVLVSEPIQSLLYLHAQPPLLNALIFLAHKIGGPAYENLILFNSLFIGTVSAIIFKSLLIKKCSIRIALFLSVSYAIFPSTLLNVAYPFYPCLTALGYALLLYGFVMVKQDFGWSVIVFSTACILLSLSRSSFSLVHTIFFIVMYFLYVRKLIVFKSSLVFILALTLLLSLAIPIKNFIFYGFFGSSSWSSLNLAKGVGILNQHGYFINAKKIKELYPYLECKNSYHSQDTADSKTSGSANFNSCLVLEYSNIIKSKKLAGYSALTHVNLILRNTLVYFSPSDKYTFLSNRTQIASYANFVNYLQLTLPLTEFLKSFGFSTHQEVFEIRLLLVGLIIIGTVFAITKRNACMVICLTIIIIHYASHVLTDGYESKRFVFDIEFIFFIIGGLLVNEFRKSVNKPYK